MSVQVLLLLAAAACGVSAFGNGAHSHPLAAWLAPVLLLAFVRAAPGRRGLLAAWLLFAATWAVQWSDVFRARGLELVIGALLFGGLGLLPYLADRRWSPRLAPWAGTFVFPCAIVAFELLLARGSPYGAWGMVAYTQADVAPVAQLAALAGTAGVAFLVAWLAPVALLAFRDRLATRDARTTAVAWSLVAVLALGWGWQRVHASAQSGTSLAIAFVLPDCEANCNYEAARAPALIDGLFRRSAGAAAAGARLIAWPEDSFFVPRTESAALAVRAAAFAREHGVHLMIAYGERERASELRYRNLSVLFGPDGAELWRYAKSHGVPGYEEKYMARGDGRLVSASTSFGRVAGMICFDADHSGMLRQLGGAHDLLLLPSDDWPAIEWLHAAMVRIRAIEQGIAIARPTINGRSVAYDARGRVVAELPAGSSGTILAAQLPLAREATPFVRIGDAPSWACVAALGLLAFASRRRRTAALTVAA